MSQPTINEYVEKFELYGEEYSIIKPTGFEELMKAREIKDMLFKYYSSLDQNDEEKQHWQKILDTQDDNIRKYLDSLGEFDNSLLINNITYLAKKNGIRFGDLESELGLSAGYISRTAKVDSKKRMSIDMVWKISRLFEVELNSLIGRDLSLPERGIDILIRFIEKLTEKTIASEISWRNHGGCQCGLLPKYSALGVRLESGNDVASYYVKHPMDEDMEDHMWVLSRDIYCYKDFHKGKDLVIISFAAADNPKYQAFDFFLIWDEYGRIKNEMLFSTSDDAFAGLNHRAAKLVDTISRLELEPMITKEHRNVIEAFLKEEEK